MPGGTLSRALLATALLLTAASTFAQAPVPQLKARVTDSTGTLTAEQRAALETRLGHLESRKGSQVAVLMVASVQPEEIEQYAIRVFDQWKLGRKTVDDGVLLVIAKNDRKLRIEVGRGLEGAIPDAYAKRIIEEEIAPRFKQGDYYGGISSGVERISRLIDGEAMPAPERAAPSSRPDSGNLLIAGFIAVMFVGGLLRRMLGRLAGSAITGLAAGAVAYFLFGVIAAVLVAVGALLITLMGGFGTGGTWFPGGGGWSSGGGGYSGGGGFGGGGGSSAGGGASGSW
jgi:uncharacterized protein